MNSKLLLITIISIFIIIIFILNILKKEKINIKYAILWLVSFGMLLLLLLIPNLLSCITKLLGFKLSSNMLIVLFIAILIILNIYLTVIVSEQTEKIRLLIQEISIIKGEVKSEKRD